MVKKKSDDIAELIDAVKNAADTEPVIRDPLKEAENFVPSYSSPEWESFVMSQFTTEELMEGKYPKLNGLRRVADLVLGDVVFSGPVKVESLPTTDSPGRATVTYGLKFLWKLGIPEHIGIGDHLPLREFLAVGDSYPGNTPNPTFAVFPQVIAENRAESRALRKALRISVVSAEELPVKGKEDFTQMAVQEVVPVAGESRYITQTQINSITIMCSRLMIDREKFINIGELKYDAIEKVPYDRALKMVAQLNKYQTNSADVPESILIKR